MKKLICQEWAVEVCEDKGYHDKHAQEAFIVLFIGQLYQDMADGHPVLSKIVSLHFSRIHMPERDGMGSYVRLRIFVTRTSLVGVKAEIDKLLVAFREKKKKSIDSLERKQRFRTKKRVLNWEKTCEDYGDKELAEIFRNYLAMNSVTVYALLRKKGKGVDIDKHLWSWTHFFFNGVRGYGSKVVDFGPNPDIKLIGNL